MLSFGPGITTRQAPFANHALQDVRDKRQMCVEFQASFTHVQGDTTPLKALR